MLLEAIVLVVAILGGAIATITGFGIGSLLTPLLAVRIGAKLAVAAVTLPHLLATALRLWRLRGDVDRHVLVRFGLFSAAGGLCGALLHGYVSGSAVRITFGALLVFAGLMGLTGWGDRLRFPPRLASLAGFVSGALGGLAGTQGGIRAAALMGTDLSKTAFIATATATGLIVDLARSPVYLATQWRELLAVWPLVAWATAGALIGTLLGERLLRWIPEHIFRRLVSALILVLGLTMIALPQFKA
jgi:uncharacterized membrane protein YfcA